MGSGVFVCVMLYFWQGLVRYKFFFDLDRELWFRFLFCMLDWIAFIIDTYTFPPSLVLFLVKKKLSIGPVIEFHADLAGWITNASPFYTLNLPFSFCFFF